MLSLPIPNSSLIHSGFLISRHTHNCLIDITKREMRSMASSASSRGIAAIVGVGPNLGLSIARKFAHEGYTVAILARDLGRYPSSQTQTLIPVIISRADFKSMFNFHIPSYHTQNKTRYILLSSLLLLLFLLLPYMICLYAN